MWLPILGEDYGDNFQSDESLGSQLSWPVKKVSKLFVVPKYHGFGIASMLLSYAISQECNNSTKSILSVVDESNISSLKVHNRACPIHS